MTRVVRGMQAVAQQWKGALVGLLLGLCIIYLLEVTPTPSLVTPFYQAWNGPSYCNPLPQQPRKGPSILDVDHTRFQPAAGLVVDLEHGDANLPREQLKLLLASWEASSTSFVKRFGKSLSRKQSFLPSFVPKAPHLKNCEECSTLHKILDSWGENGTLPYWTLWKGEGFGLHMKTNKNVSMQRLYPPWVEGADEDNLPLTRQVQVDIWKHQHPQDCQSPSLRFLLVDWETDPGFGIGAQIASMAGMFAIALTEQRILVSNYYNRADHEECVGSNHARWSCYFLSETSKECRNRALLLSSQSGAWVQGLITGKSNYTSRQIWAGKTPRQWGKPWEAMQPTTQIDGKMLIHHKAKDRRWWRAQAVRYLMRFPSEYMCLLLNEARHEAFGVEAALMVLNTLHYNWPKQTSSQNDTDIEQFLWKIYKPWMPRPLVSIHVRQGDKAKEMKVVGFKDYMKLAQLLRNRFPDARHIWLSTEMQEVIEESKAYSKWWDIYYTNVSRQTGNTSMPAYESSLGRATSTNYPLVNFLISADADFFVGALGSTWCYLIDGMRTTGGKVMAGYLSVNKYRFW
ncbi:hypothetical protein L7F22_015289 [Adiantum nelumboides]|nr:hypothetical protein [Adiantum nelumboides]